jgi:hypothetical protein
MSGPKRNPDRLNTIGIVVVGLCGAVLVYVTIVALQAFYVNDTSEIQTIADYGGQDTVSRSLRSDQLSRIGEYASNPRPAQPKANEAAKPQTYRVPIDVAMKLVVEAAKTDPSSLIPSLGRSDKSTVLAIFGRPKPLPAAPAPAAAAPAPDAAAGAAQTLPAAPLVPTGAGTGPSPVGGAGPLDKSATPGTPGNPTGTPPDKALKGANGGGATPSTGTTVKPAPAPKTPGGATKGSTTAPRTPASKGNGK